jgi:hypothetical protein
MSNWSDPHLEVVSTMVRIPIAGGHHKQRQTVKGYCSGFDGDVLDDAIDDLVAAGIIREKGRDTITLRSVQTGKDFLRKHDTDDDYSWYY